LVLGVAVLTSAVDRRFSAQKLQLDASERRYQLLIEGVKDYAIFMLTPNGHVASWNPGAERIKGYQAEEIIGRHFSCLIWFAGLKVNKLLGLGNDCAGYLHQAFSPINPTVSAGTANLKVPKEVVVDTFL
jgi:hypothetical protein